MNTEHEHDWQCHPDDPKLVECTDKECNTVAFIKELLIKTERVATKRATYETYQRCVKNSWLTRAARKKVNDFLLDKSWKGKRNDSQKATTVALV